MFDPNMFVEGKGGVKPIPTIVPTPNEYETAGDTGFTTLWVVFIIMLASSAIFTFLAWNIPVSRRLYHVITAIITLTAAISYFAMATGQATGYNCAKVKDHHGKLPSTHHLECRQVYYARYIDWAITTPLLLLDLCLLAGIDGAHTFMAIVADLIMILTGLFAAFGSEKTGQKWGWYTIACVAYIFVIWHVALHGFKATRARGAKVGKLFGSLAGFTLILWTIYPIVWGVADGARKASVDTEIVSYAILDVLAKPIFGLWLLLAHRSIPETNIDIGGYWSHGMTTEGNIRLDDDNA